MDVELFEDITMKKAIYIICISVVFFYGLLTFKTSAINTGSTHTVKDRNIKEIVSDGFVSLKLWGHNTISSLYSQGNSSNKSKFDSSTCLSKNNEVDTYKSNSLKTFMNEIATYSIKKVEELVKNCY